MDKKIFSYLSLILTTLMISFSLTLSASALNKIAGAVVIFGPDGKAFQFTSLRQDTWNPAYDQIVIRHCSKNSTKEKIASAAGCEIESGKTDLLLSVYNFEELLTAALYSLKDTNPALFTNPPKTNFEYRLIDFANDPRSWAKKANDLKNAQRSYDQFLARKQETPNDIDFTEEAELTKTLKEAQLESSYIETLKLIVEEINSVRLKKIFLDSQSSSDLTYNILKLIATAEDCNSEKVNQANSNYICRAGGRVLSLWRVEDNVFVRELTTFRKVTKLSPGAPRVTQIDAMRSCPYGMHIPTGYNLDYYQPENRSKMPESELKQLDERGMREVLFPFSNNVNLWSSSLLPKEASANPGPRGISAYFEYGIMHFIAKDQNELLQYICVSDEQIKI